jgi:hypothetical protein
MSGELSPRGEGFVRLSRRAFQHFLWEEKRRKSRWEAWVDLIQTAAYAPEKILVRGCLASVARGELAASLRYLGQRWNWDKCRVDRFLELLRAEAMIETRSEAGETIIKLCNYEHYNPLKDTAETPCETVTQTPAGQSQDGGETKLRKEEGKKERTYSPLTAGEDELPSGKSCQAPELKQFQVECARYSIPAWYAETKFQNFAVRGWRIGATPVIWKQAIKCWVARDYQNDGRPQQPPPPAISFGTNQGHARQTTLALTTAPNNGF